MVIHKVRQMNEDIFLIAAIFSCNKYHSLFAEKYEILKLEWSRTLLRNHIQPERWGTDRFFSYYHFSYIYGLFHCIFKIFHWGPSEKMPVLYAAMAENHFRVAKSGFWGELLKNALKFGSVPTLSSDNSRSKTRRPKNHHIFGIVRTLAFTWWYPGYVFLYQNLK